MYTTKIPNLNLRDIFVIKQMIKLHLAWKFTTNLFVEDYKKRAFCEIVLPKGIMILGGGVMIILRKLYYK